MKWVNWRLRQGGKKPRPVLVPEPAPLHMMALEPRLVLDAAMADTLSEFTDQSSHQVLADRYAAGAYTLPEVATVQADDGALDQDEATDDTDKTASEIAFIAADTPDIDMLIADLPTHVEIVLLDGTADGVVQIAQSLEGRTDLDAIHIISHGDAGALYLGSATLDADAMAQVYEEQLDIIGSALGVDGDILVYGCDFGAGAEGQAASALLAELTGADIASSTDLTGSAEEGGDWVLERTIGTVEAQSVSASTRWGHTLAPVELTGQAFDAADVDVDEDIGSDRIEGQTFKLTGGSFLTTTIGATVDLKADPGAPEQDVTVSIRLSHDGTRLAQGTISSSLIGTEYSTQVFIFNTPIPLIRDLTYYLMVESDSDSNTINLASANRNDVGDYADGRYVEEDGTFRNNHDIAFSILGSGPNTPPRITSDGGGDTATVQIDENETAVTTIVATDDDQADNTLTYSISGGDDAGLFQIDGSTGELSFIVAPDFGAPGDADGDNSYEIDVAVEDDENERDVQSITVEVLNVIGPNTAPSGSTPDINMDEDGTYNGTVTVVDPNDFATFVASTNVSPTNGTLLVNANGDFTYTPFPNFAGTDQFEILIEDNGGLTDTVSVNVTVNPLPDAPTGSAANINMEEDGVYNGLVTMTDVDMGDTPTASAGTLPDHGVLDVQPDGTFTYTPDTNFNGTDRFTIIVTDDGGATDRVTIDVTVAAKNDAPTGSAADIIMAEDTSFGGVISMDDVDIGDTPEASPGTLPTNGTLTVGNSGAFIYTPNPNFNGPDGFTITVTDDAGASTDVAIAVNVTSEADDPVGIGMDFDVDEDDFYAGTITMSDADAGDTVTATAGMLPANGKLTVEADGSFTYRPNPDYEGSDAFSIKVTDSTGRSTEVPIDVTVNPLPDPIFAENAAFTIDEDGFFNGTIALTGNDTDTTVTVETAPQNGVVVLGADGAFAYRPDADYEGSDRFVLRVENGFGAFDLAEIDVSVTAQNDAPVATGGSADAVSGEPLRLGTDVLGYSDVDNGTFQSITLSALNLAGGTLSHSGGSVIVGEGSVVTRAQLDGLIYTPPATETDITASFAYAVNDGEVLGLPATLTVAVDGVPQPTVTVTAPVEPPVSKAVDLSPDNTADAPVEVAVTEPVVAPQAELTTATEPTPITAPAPQPEASAPVEAVAQAPAPAAAAPAPVQAIPEPAPIVAAPPVAPIQPAPISAPPLEVTPVLEPQAPSAPPPILPSLALNYTFEPLDRPQFARELDELNEEVTNYQNFQGTVAANVTFAFGSLLSVGGVSFALRGGLLAAALMSAMPAWKRFDPITIVAKGDDNETAQDPSEAQRMMEFVMNARARVTSASLL